MRIQLLLLNGEHRTLELPSRSGTMANALARLDDWIETSDGGWVQKSFIVEVRLESGSPARNRPDGSDGEYEALETAAGELAQDPPDGGESLGRA